MKRIYLPLLTGALCLQPSFAQLATETSNYQLLVQQARPVGAPAQIRPERGKPFSATAVTKTSQILQDGTHVDQTNKRVEYRDSEGRIRTETQQQSLSYPVTTRTMISIVDPVANVTYNLNPEYKTGTKTMRGAAGAVTFESGGGGRGGSGGRGGRGGSGAQLSMSDALGEIGALFVPVPDHNNNLVEDLGVSNINGIYARGTRRTTIIPAGSIGNDKQFRSVTEEWYSADLNLLIRSVSTDPRFGTTTYELTDIRTGEPDPTLFQVPADYNVVTPPVRVPVLSAPTPDR